MPVESGPLSPGKLGVLTSSLQSLYDIYYNEMLCTEKDSKDWASGFHCEYWESNFFTYAIAM